MGIFNEPKRLALLLASVKTSGIRPLLPVQVAEWIQEGIKELGDEKELMKRLDLGGPDQNDKSMMNGFENLITKVSEDLRQTAVWGKTDVENYKFNFTALHLMSSLNVEDQNRLFSACTESAKKGITFPTKEEFKRIREYYNKNKPDKTIDDAIAYILKIDRPPAGFAFTSFVALLTADVFERLVQDAEKRGTPINELVSQILAKKFGDDSVKDVKIKEGGIMRILFSKEAKSKFDQMAVSKKSRKNDMINRIMEEGL